MSKTIALSNRAWGRLKEKIVEDYGRTTIMISWRLKDQLGFTVREHYDYNGDYDDRKPIRLDFWCEQMQTMFLLKYSDYLTTEHNPNVYRSF